MLVDLSIKQFIFLLAAYLIAALPFGVIISRAVLGKDVRSHGSGNIGATNVSRLMGKKWGIFVLFLDALKGFLIVNCAALFGDDAFCNLAAVVAVIAHCYPIYLGFKGGKGVATALGVLLALSPISVGICLIVFLLVVGLTRIISAASLAASLSLPIMSTILQGQVSFPAAVAMCMIIWWKHRENISRLMRRQEPRFF
jgi:acyl phosphate:glycerol-3-phosphate acyltransferase